MWPRTSSAPSWAPARVPVSGGRLALGEFRRVVLMEFEGPRRRRIEIRLLAGA